MFRCTFLSDADTYSSLNDSMLVEVPDEPPKHVARKDIRFYDLQRIVEALTPEQREACRIQPDAEDQITRMDSVVDALEEAGDVVIAE